MIDSADLMHATLQKLPFSSRDWLFEWKFDGFRCLIKKYGEQIDLISREGKPFNASFPEIAKAVADVPGDFVWDAELAIGSGRGEIDFATLQQRAHTVSPRNVRAAARKYPARLYVFDILASGKNDFRDRPLFERKERLRDSFDDTARLVYATHVDGMGEFVFEQMQLHDFEGMVAKRTWSVYMRGRSLNWIKVKNAAYSRQAAPGFGRVR
ncbi:ATP-dependent DNA ligase [Paraburkholderia terrae]